MALFALRRLLLSIPLLIGITFVSYVVISLAPGGAPRFSPPPGPTAPPRAAPPPPPRGSQRLPGGEGACGQGVRARPAHPRAVLAVAQARGAPRLRALVPARRAAGAEQDRGAP